jgi:hypothetical protein
MAHINSHVQRRLSKILDHRHRPQHSSLCRGPDLGGSRSYSNALWGLDIPVANKKWHTRIRRHTERRAWAHLKDFRCSGGLECDCPGCCTV